MTTVKNIYDYINSIAPFDTQEEWDNSGFLAGDFRREVNRCVVTLDVTRDVLAYAKEQKAELILSHHPAIFSKLTAVTSDRLIYDIVRSGISVVCAHTNYDMAAGGINDVLAERLGLNGVTVCQDGLLRIGELSTALDSAGFAKHVKERLHTKQLRYSATSKQIKRVAVCGGAGSDFIAATQSEADAYVTGDASYHTLLDAGQADFCLIAAGHYETEFIGVQALSKRLEAFFEEVYFIDPKQEHPVHIL